MDQVVLPALQLPPTLVMLTLDYNSLLAPTDTGNKQE